MIRRTFLIGLLSALTAGRARGGTSPGPTLEGFLHLSSALCEVPEARLDRAAARLYLDSLRSWAGDADLRLLAAAAGSPGSLARLEGSGLLARPRLRRLAEAILECWYTGIYETPGGLRVATFEGAMAWDALEGVSPPTVCGA